MIPSGIADLVAESEDLDPIKEEPFESLLPGDAKDLLEEGAVAAPVSYTHLRAHET